MSGGIPKTGSSPVVAPTGAPLEPNKAGASSGAKPAASGHTADTGFDPQAARSGEATAAPAK